MRNLIIILSLLTSSMAQAIGPNFLPEEAIQNATSATSLRKDKPWYWARVGVSVGIHAISIVNYAILAGFDRQARDLTWLTLGAVVPLIGLATEGYAHWQHNQIKVLQNKKPLSEKAQPNQVLAITMMGLPSLAVLGAAGLWGAIFSEDDSIRAELYKTWVVAWKNLVQGKDVNGKALSLSDIPPCIFSWTSHLSIPLNIWTAILIYKQNTELKRLARA